MTLAVTVWLATIVVFLTLFVGWPALHHLYTRHVRTFFRTRRSLRKSIRRLANDNAALRLELHAAEYRAAQAERLLDEVAATTCIEIRAIDIRPSETVEQAIVLDELERQLRGGRR